MVGTQVTHQQYGWAGQIAPFGHTDDRLMIIWNLGGSQRGASLWEPEVLTVRP